MSKTACLNLPDLQYSEALAARLASCLIPPLVLTFRGEIGVGKTTFIRALLRALGLKSAIKSPTFTLLESYDCQQFHIYHFDLYRIHDETELEYIGFRDYFAANAICCIEWPEHARHSLEHIDIEFNFTMNDDSTRLLTVTAESTAGEAVLAAAKITGRI